jgi:hypothetical protein
MASMDEAKKLARKSTDIATLAGIEDTVTQYFRDLERIRSERDAEMQAAADRMANTIIGIMRQRSEGQSSIDDFGGDDDDDY